MSYIGNQPVLNTSEFREEFAVTSTQSVFNTGGFTASSDSATLEVLRNGVLLGTADYTLGSDASTVTLANAAVNGDIIVIKGRRELTNGVQVTERRHEHTMGSGETTVTFPYPLTVSQTDVYLNGVKLGASDFSINSSTRVVSFTTNPAVGDLVAIVSREPALTANSSLPVVDAAGNNVLSESGGVVTLTADTAVIEGSSSGDLVRITQTGSGNALVVEDSANPDSTPFVVNSSGNVGVGTSPTNRLTLRPADGDGILIQRPGSTAAHLLISTNAGGVSPNYTTTYDTNNTEMVFSTVSSGGTGGIISFKTGVTTSSERMRIDSNGSVTINTLGSGDVYSSLGNLYISSDIRLKNDLGVIDESAIEIIKQLTPRYYSWKDDESSRQQLGFFAQEVFPILPEAVPRDLKYEQNGVDENNEPILEQVLDENGEPDYQWGFATQPIVAMLVKAVQEQQTLIESQQSQIDTLTTKTQEQDLTIASLISRIEALEATP